MLNIVIPLGGRSKFFDDHEYPYPVPLVEVRGKPMIELVIKNLQTAFKEVNFIFVVKRDECKRFHLDRTLHLLAENSTVIQLDGETKGAVCSVLMAIDHIDNETPLVIANGDQIFDDGLSGFIKQFDERGADAGCVYFESVLPRWSYVKVLGGEIQEAAEKKPISKHAIAGVYYFQRGSNFVAAAKQLILHDAHVDGLYYAAPVFNELILDQKRLIALRIDNDKYHTFYSPQKIEQYEKAPHSC